MFNNHTMSLVTNLNIIGPEINNPEFVTVAAVTTSDYPQHPNIYNASILMPPIEILTRWADGDPLVMQYEYPRYLMQLDPDNMISALVAALTKKNIILYIPQDEFNIFGQLLLNHIYYVYGITLTTPTTQFCVIPTKIPFIMAKFYSIDVMDANEFLAAYPANAPLPDFVIGKLANDLHPFNRPASFSELAEYFNQLNASKASGNKQTNQMIRIIDNQ